MTQAARQIIIKGQVQGVGFRPFVYNLAHELGVLGNVANGPSGVEISAQGADDVLDQFIARLQSSAPTLAQIESIESTSTVTNVECLSFEILQSGQGEIDMPITPDAAVCDDCLKEMFDPSDRRYLYPFINCTHCGPRYSIIKNLPYDRANTTMNAFEQCPDCLSEYSAPTHRRFHAQPNACAQCGPSLAFVDQHGQESNDAIGQAVNLIQQGKVVAVKGIGGFHLVCDARNADAVALLRQRKQRPHKPFAIMGLNTASLEEAVVLNQERRDVLTSSQAPICLCPKTPKTTQKVTETVAPQLAWLGVMLPHSPLHYLLFHRLCNQPEGEWYKHAQQPLLVMTSANHKGMPLITDNDEALELIGSIADGVLLHDRDIHTRADDSIVSMVADPPTYPVVIRQGRGFSPKFIPLSCGVASHESFERISAKGYQQERVDQLGKALTLVKNDSLIKGSLKNGSSNKDLSKTESILALGAFYKNTLCLTKGHQAYVSQYIGDLDNAKNCRALLSTIDALTSMLGIQPDRVVCDKHPDFFSTRCATEYAQKHKLPLEQVQHHHAHIASVMAEHQITQPVIGVALDGLGLGDDGALWGGEFLYVENGNAERMGHLATLPLPSGDKAAQEPWRVAVGLLHQLNILDSCLDSCLDNCLDNYQGRYAEFAAFETLKQMLSRSLNCPETSSAGRLFDAVSSLLGLCDFNSYEGQAAMQLESAAWDAFYKQGWPDDPSQNYVFKNNQLDFSDLIPKLLGTNDSSSAALCFHQQFVSALTVVITHYAEQKGCRTVVLGGGCFLNQLLLSQLVKALETIGLTVFYASSVPANDGGISLGQAYTALTRAQFIHTIKTPQ